MAPNIAKCLSVRGTIQGVGFRPFVFQLATRLDLGGMVSNTSEGVAIHVEGARAAVDIFCKILKKEPPPLSHITAISSKAVSPEGVTGFSIGESVSHLEKAAFIPPDVGVCDNCLSELRDPRDRRYRYPFITCTHCGPRYSIIEDLPYDRPLTMMNAFPMCKACRAEYEDPASRRFHAQPIACPDCGPRVFLYDAGRRLVPGPDPILEARDLLKSGHILAIKGLGGFHLAVDALNDDAVKRLRDRKKRPDKPLAIMSPSLAEITRYAMVSPGEAKTLQAHTKPIVLLKKKSPCLLSEAVAPGNRRAGVMLPYTPLHYLLTEGTTALVMTSGNAVGSPVEKDTDRAFASLSGVADYFLVHDRMIYQRCDDSVVQHVGGGSRMVRRARGFAPSPIRLKNAMPQVLAVGGELKNTICLTRQQYAFLSQHIGDMTDADTFRVFEETVHHMKHVLGISPECVAHDLHPDFETTRYAQHLFGVEKIAVQHHHAHVAACMAEHHLTGPVIGLALDGSGYGGDGAVWGGEVLVADTTRFHRAAHLDYVPMPGGDAAVREPWRMALGYLHHAYGSGFRDLDLAMLGMLDAEAVAMTEKMISGKVNTPLTSSLGRLFDGVAALTGLRQRVTFESQAAMELEAVAGTRLFNGGPRYPYDIHGTPGAVRHVGLGPLIRAVTEDVMSDAPRREISRRFHLTVIDLFTDLCVVLGRETGIRDTVLSGGVFQNALILSGLSRSLAKNGFKVYSHSRVPANDGGLCLGQALVAGSRR